MKFPPGSVVIYTDKTNTNPDNLGDIGIVIDYHRLNGVPYTTNKEHGPQYKVDWMYISNTKGYSLIPWEVNLDFATKQLEIFTNEI